MEIENTDKSEQLIAEADAELIDAKIAYAEEMHKIWRELHSNLVEFGRGAK